MTDPRYTKLAKLLVNYSTELKKGDRILLDMIDVPDEFTVELIRAVRAAGATPFVEARHTRVAREQLLGITEQQADRCARPGDVPHEKDAGLHRHPRQRTTRAKTPTCPATACSCIRRVIRPVQDYRVNKTRWCVLRWPTPSMAQAAGMSTEAFENLYFDVCTMDYAKMAPRDGAAGKADEARPTASISKAPGTDLTFSIKGIGAKMCKGDRNIPDGEVFSCPVKDSVNGVIQFNTPTLYSGTKFENVRLEFKDGKIVKATANNTKRLNEILDTDAGRALHRRIFARLQSLHSEPDVRHFV